MATTQGYFDEDALHYRLPLPKLNKPNSNITKFPSASQDPLNTSRLARRPHHHDNAAPRHFPRIILKDKLGRELDTKTSFQDAIYESRWRIANGELATMGPGEWRLPSGLVPARPDFSRTIPQLGLQRLFKKEMKRRQRNYNSLPEFIEALQAEKEYEELRWNLQQMETLPALVGADLLQQESDRFSNRTYLPFVGSAPYINRHVAEPEVRESEYNFPGFCSGCARSGLCYGCERDPNPHYHKDRQVRTGGGFTYYKRDKPASELNRKNPLNWKIPPMSGPYGYVFYDNAPYPDIHNYRVGMRISKLPEEVDDEEEEEEEEGEEEEGEESNAEMEDYSALSGYDKTLTEVSVGGRTTITIKTSSPSRTSGGQDYSDPRLSSQPATTPGSDLTTTLGSTIRGTSEGSALIQENLDPDKTIHVDVTRQSSGYTFEDLASMLPSLTDAKSAGSRRRSMIRPLGSLTPSQSYDITGSEGFQSRSSGSRTTPSGKTATAEAVVGSTNIELAASIKLLAGHNIQADAGPQNDEIMQALQDYMTEADLVREEDTPGSRESEKSSKKRQGLYKAPKAFQLKASKKKTTVSADPFSKDRDLNVPKGDGFNIKKSDKELTKFIDIDRGDAKWEEPDKFELKKAENATTEHRAPPTKPSSGHKVKRRSPPPHPPPPRPKAKEPPPVRVPSPAVTVSPDSGISTAPAPNLETTNPSSSKGPHAAEGVKSPDPEPTSPPKLPTPPPPRKPAETKIEVQPTPTPPPPKLPTPPPPKSPTPPPPPPLPPPVVEEAVKEPTPPPKSPPPPRPTSTTPPPPPPPPTPPPPPPQRRPDPKSVESPTPEPTPPAQPPPPPKEKKQKAPPVKKTRKEPEKKDKTPPITKTPPLPDIPPAPEPEPEPELEREPTPPPPRKIEPPPLPTAAPPVPPTIREFAEPERPVREVSRTVIEVPPPMLEPPPQRKPPPKQRLKRPLKRRPMVARKPTEAPVVKEDLSEIQDPLDYLARFCIIHPERLPFYERVFYKTLKEQLYRYVDVPHDELHPAAEREDAAAAAATGAATAPTTEEPTSKDEVQADKDKEQDTIEKGKPVKNRLTDHEHRMIEDLSLINRTTAPRYATVGMNSGDQAVAKINYTLDTLIDKYELLQERMDDSHQERVALLADLAKIRYPQIIDPDFAVGKKKKKGKGKKAKDDKEVVFGSNEVGVQTDMYDNQARLHPKTLTASDIVKKLDKKMMDMLADDPTVSLLNVELERLQEKLRDVDDRIEDLEDERKLLQLFARDEYQRQQTVEAKPEPFHRRQSVLYQKMHPIPKDQEMNLSELEEALQSINGHLISEKELQYIYHILELPQRQRINVQLFSVVAALSEKVAQVDPFIRKLINKFDFEALNVKMDRAKELFYLLDEKDSNLPAGKIAAHSLGVELAAGGVSREHAQYVVEKFNREKKGVVDFLDFLTYVPLFIEIHGRIIQDPLCRERTW